MSKRSNGARYRSEQGKTLPCSLRYLAPLLLLLIFLLSSCSFDGTVPITATPTPDAQAVLSKLTPESLTNLQQTAQLLLMTPHPVRDLYSLAQRLKLHNGPIPHIGRTTPLNEQVGQEDSFWISNLDTNQYSHIRARLVYVTPHVYMYIEDGHAVNLAALAYSANIFEQKIYPTDRADFGSEWSPGIDDDVHLTILNAVGLGASVGGYYSSEDEYPTSVNLYSNEREMFYVNLDGTMPGSADYDSTLAHEFQHMIHWYQHPVDLSWTNEGMSVLAQHLNGFSATGVDRSFIQSPDTQLNDWSDDMNVDLAHYGAGYLFMDYFAEHYGGYGVLKELLQDPASPPLNFDHVLAKHGYTDRFMDVMHKWFIANYVQNPNIELGAYGYASIQLPGVTPQHTVASYPFAEDDTVHQNAAEYYTIEPGRTHGTLHVQLAGTPLVRIIANDPYQATDEWWSNRYDNMDSTLTRSFDLSSLKGKHASLNYAAWFDLERNYDYAYIEVSTDSINWTTLKGQYTTATNPQGANLGNGYTGTSGGGTIPQWVQEHIDLTPYAGKKIQVRFEEVTDDAVNLQGFALDAIQIPELHFQDNVSTNDGWLSNGFIRSNNVLPEQYNLQALLYQGQTFTVSNVAVDLASGQGTLSIPGFGRSITKVVLVVSASAPETTQLAQYHLSLSLT